VVRASAFVAGPAGRTAHLEPRDGKFRFELVTDAERPVAASMRWLDSASAADVGAAFPAHAWNLELMFDSAAAGECPMRVSFEPSSEGAQQGLGPASTTIVLKDAPPPPGRN